MSNTGVTVWTLFSLLVGSRETLHRSWLREGGSGEALAVFHSRQRVITGVKLPSAASHHRCNYCYDPRHQPVIYFHNNLRRATLPLSCTLMSRRCVVQVFDKLQPLRMNEVTVITKMSESCRVGVTFVYHRIETNM